MIANRTILIYLLLLVFHFNVKAERTSENNTNQEWVFILKCTELGNNQSAEFEQLLTRATIMRQNDHEIILLVNKTVMDSLNISSCGCVTQQSMPLFRSVSVDLSSAQAKTELVASEKTNNETGMVLKLLFNRLPSSLYSPLVPMHAASLTLMPEFEDHDMSYGTKN